MIALGTIWGGWRIIETMGLRITISGSTPTQGWRPTSVPPPRSSGPPGSGIPISTTQAAAASVMGSGAASGQGVNLRVVGEMVLAWVVTIPATLVIGWVMFQLTALPGPAAFVAVGAVLFVLFGWIAWAMSKALRAEDVAAEMPSDDELAAARRRGTAHRGPRAPDVSDAPQVDQAPARSDPRWRRYVPILGWLRSYDRHRLRPTCWRAAWSQPSPSRRHSATPPASEERR